MCKFLDKYFVPFVCVMAPFSAVLGIMPERPLAWVLALYGSMGWVLMWREARDCDRYLQKWGEALKLAGAYYRLPNNRNDN